MVIERLFLGGFALAMASLFGFIGLVGLRQSYKRLTKGRVAKGVGIGYKTQRDCDREIFYYPEVKFDTPSGEQVVFTASSGSTRRPTLGRKYKVRYYPDNPQDADLSSVGALALGVVVLIFATFALVASILFWFT